MKIVVAGGTGFIGEYLISRLLAAGDTVMLLTRGGPIPPILSQRVRVQTWDGQSIGGWAQAVNGADAVINLCGEGVACKRWSQQQKKLLRSSRLDPTRALVQAIRSAKVKPKVLVNISAVGFYGTADETEADEQFPQGKGFLAELCADWEAAAREVETLGVRLVLPRLGVVLGPGKSALQKMTKPFYWFLGGPLGSGKQWFSWVHVQDVVSGIFFAIKNETISGPLNFCAPYPVRMNEFCETLGRVLNRPSWIRVPAWILQLLLGEMAEMLVDGQKVIPKKMLKHGFKFRHAFLESALISILGH